MRKTYQTVILTGFLSLGLVACGKGESVQEMVGMDRSGPDAFNVVSRPPLSVPPEFELRPPAPVGTPGPGEPKMDDVARSLLTGDESGSSVETAVMGVGSAGLDTTGERSLMERFGANKADPLIREQLTTDLYTKQEETSSWLNDVIPSLRDQTKKDELDPIEEVKKLRESDTTQNAVQAPPEDFLKKAEKEKKKTVANRDRMLEDVNTDDSTVQNLNQKAPAAKAAAAAENKEAQAEEKAKGELPPPTDAVKE